MRNREKERDTIYVDWTHWTQLSVGLGLFGNILVNEAY